MRGSFALWGVYWWHQRCKCLHESSCVGSRKSCWSRLNSHFNKESPKKTKMSLLGFTSNNNNTNNSTNIEANKHVAQPRDPDLLMRHMDRSIAAVEYERATNELSKCPLPHATTTMARPCEPKTASCLLGRLEGGVLLQVRNIHRFSGNSLVAIIITRRL